MTLNTIPLFTFTFMSQFINCDMHFITDFQQILECLQIFESFTAEVLGKMFFEILNLFTEPWKPLRKIIERISGHDAGDVWK